MKEWKESIIGTGVLEVKHHDDGCVRIDADGKRCPMRKRLKVGLRQGRGWFNLMAHLEDYLEFLNGEDITIIIKRNNPRPDKEKRKDGE